MFKLKEETLHQYAECLNLSLNRHDHEDSPISFWFPANIYQFKVTNKDIDIELAKTVSEEASKILFKWFADDLTKINTDITY